MGRFPWTNAAHRAEKWNRERAISFYLQAWKYYELELGWQQFDVSPSPSSCLVRQGSACALWNCKVSINGQFTHIRGGVQWELFIITCSVMLPRHLRPILSATYKKRGGGGFWGTTAIYFFISSISRWHNALPYIIMWRHHYGKMPLGCLLYSTFSRLSIISMSKKNF
jgi:hypothetical protein